MPALVVFPPPCMTPSKDCAKTFLQSGLIPASMPVDATQLAFATIYRIDYLLTWNRAHLANEDVQKRLEEINKKMNWRSPRLKSPATIPWNSLGEEIRRRDE